MPERRPAAGECGLTCCGDAVPPCRYPSGPPGRGRSRRSGLSRCREITGESPAVTAVLSGDLRRAAPGGRGLAQPATSTRPSRVAADECPHRRERPGRRGWSPHLPVPTRSARACRHQVIIDSGDPATSAASGHDLVERQRIAGDRDGVAAARGPRGCQPHRGRTAARPVGRCSRRGSGNGHEVQVRRGKHVERQRLVA